MDGTATMTIDNEANNTTIPGNLQKGAGGQSSTVLCSSKTIHDMPGSGIPLQLTSYLSRLGNLIW